MDRHNSMLRPAINAETSLADVLERVLDKGMIIAGDISISLVDVELLTIKVRLLLASVDRATEMGIDWWRHDPFLTSQAAALTEERRALQDRLQRLEDLLHAGAATPAEDRATRLGPPND